MADAPSPSRTQPVPGTTPAQRNISSNLASLRQDLYAARNDITPNMFNFLDEVIEEVIVSFNAKRDQKENNLEATVKALRSVLTDVLDPLCSLYQVFKGLNRLQDLPHVRVDVLKRHIGRIEIQVSQGVNLLSDQLRGLNLTTVTPLPVPASQAEGPTAEKKTAGPAQ